jgi:hypothetical protein
MRLYEAEIREELAKPDTKTFRFAADWEQWNEHKHICFIWWERVMPLNSQLRRSRKLICQHSKSGGVRSLTRGAFQVDRDNSNLK